MSGIAGDEKEDQSIGHAFRVNDASAKHLPMVPSMGSAFFLCAVVPLAILVLPGLIHQIANYDHNSPTQHDVAIDKVQGKRQSADPTERGLEKKRDSGKVTVTTATSSSHVYTDTIDDQIVILRKTLEGDRSDVFKALALADTLRQRDLIFHDGGTVHVEAIATYKMALNILMEKRANMIASELSTSCVNERARRQIDDGIDDDFFLDYRQKSVDGLLSSTNSNLAKVFFMANMFESAVTAYDDSLMYKPHDIDSLVGRASSLIILGKYPEAANDYLKALDLDTHRLFAEIYTGLSKVFVANETAVVGGWSVLLRIVEEQIPKAAERLAASQDKGMSNRLADSLKRMHLTMFIYHDTKTKDTDLAWEHLSQGMHYKLLNVAPFSVDLERSRIENMRRIFSAGFWPDNVGSQSVLPIFVIGFVRSGSTLLERILDAHPLIVGTGEDSIFNGRLGRIRDGLVEAAPGGFLKLQQVVQSLADEVTSSMTERWKMMEERASTFNDDGADLVKPERFVDKMLTNYLNVGFINFLFPHALILHVARDPMDTLFSAFKHDFPPGHLDYMSDFSSLAEIYEGYRSIMDHWEDVLPGRIKHIRYEDLVRDTANVAKSVIDAAGLPWDEEVLNFHTKKQAVNTLSTNQVRKGIYKSAIESWKEYELHLEPLIKLIGRRRKYPLRTLVGSYSGID